MFATLNLKVATMLPFFHVALSYGSYWLPAWKNVQCENGIESQEHFSRKDSVFPPLSAVNLKSIQCSNTGSF